jgi:hypothetical protein
MDYHHDPLVEQTYDPDNGVEVDFEYIHRVRQHGDISVLFTWNFAKDNGDPEPMIALAPTYKPPRDQSPRLCCVTLTEAWKWSRTHNNDKQVVYEDGDRVRIGGDQWQREIAEYFAAVLGLDSGNPGTVRRIRGLIEDSLQDLLTMTIAPKREGRGPEGEFEIVDRTTGETVKQQSVRYH